MSKTYTSRCNDIILRGRPCQLVKKYEGMAYNETDRALRELFFNYAEHWEKEKTNDKN